MSMQNKKDTAFNWSKVKRGMIATLIIGVAVMAGLGIYADYNELGESINQFNFAYLPIILLLAPLNYCFRYVKWNYYLKHLGIKVPKKINRTTFVAGLSMTITPAKVGEFFKSYLLKELAGIKMAETMPVVLMERLTDGISMIILASIGAITFSYGYAAIIACVALVGLFIVAVRVKPVAMFLIRTLARVKFLQKFSKGFESFYNQTYELTHPVCLFVGVGIGIVSWFFEGLVIYLALRAFGVEFSILASVFTVSVSSLIGALSMLPGGLFAAEGSIMGILVLLFSVNGGLASATTIVTRFSTLWLGVAIGIVGMIFAQRMLKLKDDKKLESKGASHDS